LSNFVSEYLYRKRTLVLFVVRKSTVNKEEKNPNLLIYYTPGIWKYRKWIKAVKKLLKVGEKN
jgi:hypothetical protein